MCRKKIYRFLSLLLAVFVSFGMICFNTSEASAKSEWNIGTPDQLWVGDDGYWVNVWKGNSNAKVTSVSSSNKKAVSVEKIVEGKNKSYYIHPESAGKATINVGFKKPGSKTTTYKKKTIIVKKYPYQISSLKIDGKKIAVSKHKFRYEKGKFKSSTVDVDMKLKKGWKISNAFGNRWNMDGKGTSEIKNAMTLLKKGSAIKFPKKYSEFELLIEMTNGKSFINYHIRISRDNP